MSPMELTKDGKSLPKRTRDTQVHTFENAAASRLRGVRVPNVPAGMNCARLTATFASHVYDKGAIDTIVAFFTN